MKNSERESYWIKAIDELRSIAQAGLTYSKDVYDLERYEQIKKLSANMLSNISDVPYNKIIDIFSENKGYNTPKLDVRAGVFKGNKILLVKEESDNKWSLPGGWTDVNESPSEAIVREVNEETGFEVTVRKFVALYDKQKHGHPPQIPHAYKMFFICDIKSGEPRLSHETVSYGWFKLEALPVLSEHRVMESQIKTLFKHNSVPELHTEYD